MLSVVLLYRLLITKNRMTGKYAQFDYAPIAHVGVVVAVVAILAAHSTVQTFRSVEQATAQVEIEKPQHQEVEDVPVLVTTEASIDEESVATPSAIPRRTYRPTPTPTMEPGGWYWQEELSRSQKWIGTDAEGKDVWSEI